MNAKEKGGGNEHRSITLLEASGYACTRAAASLGTWDIVGITSRDVGLAQVKTQGWVGATNRRFRNFPPPSNSEKPVHRCRERHWRPDVREVDRAA